MGDCRGRGLPRWKGVGIPSRVCTEEGERWKVLVKAVWHSTAWWEVTGQSEKAGCNCRKESLEYGSDGSNKRLVAWRVPRMGWELKLGRMGPAHPLRQRDRHCSGGLWSA